MSEHRPEETLEDRLEDKLEIVQPGEAVRALDTREQTPCASGASGFEKVAVGAYYQESSGYCAIVHRLQAELGTPRCEPFGATRPRVSEILDMVDIGKIGLAERQIAARKTQEAVSLHLELVFANVAYIYN